MNHATFKVLIADDEPHMAEGLKNYLVNRFGSNIEVFVFYTLESLMQNVDKNTSIVILDYSMGGQNADATLKAIKKINPTTETLMLSSNENMGMAIDAFRKLPVEAPIIKGRQGWGRISFVVYNIISYPARQLGKEFGLSKFMAIFLTCLLLMGFSVFIAIKLLK